MIISARGNRDVYQIGIKIFARINVRLVRVYFIIIRISQCGSYNQCELKKNS